MQEPSCAHKPQFACLRFAGFKESPAEEVLDVLVFREDEAGDRLLDQCVSCHPQQGRDGEVGFLNQPLFAQGDIAHRREIVQIEISGPGGISFLLGPPQLLVLHIELDLVHLQFMNQAPGFFG